MNRGSRKLEFAQQTLHIYFADLNLTNIDIVYSQPKKKTNIEGNSIVTYGKEMKNSLVLAAHSVIYIKLSDNANGI